MANKSPNRNAYIGSGRVKEGGALATRMQDFNAHGSGNAFRHDADHIDMDPRLTGSLADPTVQGTLEKMAAFLSGSGQGYISIGDGYSSGDYNVGDLSTPTLYDAFVAAFANTRLQNGGVVLVKSGTYRLFNKVTVPTGITIMGEPMGTIITSAITGNQPMFEVSEMPAQHNLGYNGQETITSEVSPQFTRFYNIILADNMDGYVTSGGYRIPTINGGVLRVPFIDCKLGSHTIIERVSFLGMSTQGNDREVSNRAISTSGSSSKPTTLRVENCYADGIGSIIEFKPTSGAPNQLTVINNRFRWTGYGVGAVVTTTEDGSCISMNMCNAHIEGNYMMGMSGSSSKEFTGRYGIYVTSNAVTDSDVVINRIGNYGGIDIIAGSPSSAFVRQFFWAPSPPAAIRGADVGNNWAYGTNNNWSISIGDGTISTGDITGPTALDLALQYADYTSYWDPNTTTTFSILINYGTYSLTRGGTVRQRARLIGAMVGNTSTSDTLPVINVDISSGGYTTVFSHPAAYLGWELRNLRFQADGAAQFQYLAPAPKFIVGDEVGLVVENCVFEDVGMDLINFDNTSTSAARTTRTTLTLDHCHFYQTSTFSDELSLHITSGPDLINITNSTFNNYGYPIWVGNSASYSDTDPPNGQVLLDNCLFSMFNERQAGISVPRVTDVGPFGTIFGSNAWVTISADSERYSVTLRNCKFDGVTLNSGSTTTFDSFSPIDSGILDSGDFRYLLYVQGRDIRVEGCEINGPYQRWSSDGGVTYHPVTALYTVPGQALYVDNCTIRGALPFGIGGSAFTAPTGASEKWVSGATCSLANSYFGAYNVLAPNVAITHTCLDFDLAAISTTGFEEPKVSVTNCNINNCAPSTVLSVPYHQNNTGSAYNAIGVVQFYGQEWNFNFCNNTVDGRLPDTGMTFDTYTVVVDEVEGVSSRHKSIVISGNHISTRCESSAGSRYYGGLKVYGTGTSICGNCFSYHTGGSSLAFTQKLYIYLVNSATGIGSVSSAVVSGNNFLRTGDMYTGIYADAGSGIITGNSFDEIGPRSADENWFSYADLNNFTINNNRNQIVTARVRPWDGEVRDYEATAGASFQIWNKSLHTSSNFPYTAIELLETSYRGNNASVSNATLEGTTTVAAGIVRLDLVLPLYEILPYGARFVRLVSLTSRVSSTTWTAGTNTIVVGLYERVASSLDTLVAKDGGGNCETTHTATSTLSLLHQFTAADPTDVHSNLLYLRVRITLQSPTTRQFSLSQAAIQYIW